MLEEKLVNYAFIFVFIFERLLELLVNKFNKVFMVTRYFAKIKYPKEAIQMRIFHTLWFVALIVETHLGGKLLTGFMFYFCVIILIFAQTLRWYAIYTLGPYWSVDIYQVKEHPLIEIGPYAFIKHPNYLAVLTEFIFLPLILGCPFTMIFGTIANLLILKRRIFLEEQSLAEQSI